MFQDKNVVLEKLKNEQQYSILDLTLDDLLTKDSEGISYLEYAIKNKSHIPTNIEREIANNSEAQAIALRNGYINFLKFKSEDCLFETFEDGRRIIDIALEEHNRSVFYFYILPKVENNFEILNVIRDYKVNCYFSISPKLFINLLSSTEGFEFLKNFKGDDFFFATVANRAPHNLLMNYCNYVNDYSFLKKCDEGVLLENTLKGTTVLDELLSEGVELNFGNHEFNDIRVANILIQNKKFDLLCKGSLELLTETAFNGKTCIEVLIDEEKNNGFDLTPITIKKYYNDCESAAKLFLTLSKNNAGGYIPYLKPETVLDKDKNGNTILKCLLDLDSNYAIEYILPRKVLNDPRVVMELNRRGINNTTVMIKSENLEYSEHIAKTYVDSYALEPSVYDKQLQELQELFLADGKSDREMIDLLIKSYRGITTKENPMMLLEIEQMIAIKKANPEKFLYLKNNENNSYFDPSNGFVSMSKNEISTIRHETSHALHFYLSDCYELDEYSNIIMRIKNNPNTINRVSELSKLIHMYTDECYKSIDENDINEYYSKLYNDEEISKLNKFLTLEKDEQKNKLEKDYPEDVLDLILDNMYSAGEVIENRKRIEKKEAASAKYVATYDEISAISDIMDAVYDGKIFNGVLRDELQIRIPGSSGHGINYYVKSKHGFKEMIANYGMIIKSDACEENLKMLRYFAGDELVDMLDKCYKNIILKSNKYLPTSTIESLEEEKYVR